MTSYASSFARRGAPDSLAAVQLERLSVDDEIAQMNRGKGGKLVFAVSALALLLGGGAYWMKRVDVEQAHVAAIEGIDRIAEQKASSFMQCALPGAQPSQLASRDALRNAIENASDRFGKGYARTLAHCAPVLDELTRELTAIKAPSDLQSKVIGVQRAGSELQQGWDAYRRYLSDPKLQYDRVQAAPMVDGIAVAWDNYQHVRTEPTAR